MTVGRRARTIDYSFLPKPLANDDGIISYAYWSPKICEEKAALQLHPNCSVFRPADCPEARLR